LRVRLAWLDVRASGRADGSGAANCRQRQVQTSAGNIEVRVIENVEDLSPEFEVGGFRKLESLVEDHIELKEIRTAEEVSRHVTECSRAGVVNAAGLW
jgi:hypothetical protein